jgi:limonene-1,2-epoxide hydrolase
MSQTPSAVVTSFLQACSKSKSGMAAAYRAFFTDDTVWENIGMSVTTGAEGALQWMEQMEAVAGAPPEMTFRAEILAIAEAGNKVLTERIDHLIDASGKNIEDVRVMGVFEVADGRITAWRDYFDTAGLKTGAAQAEAAGAT